MASYTELLEAELQKEANAANFGGKKAPPFGKKDKKEHEAKETPQEEMMEEGEKEAAAKPAPKAPDTTKIAAELTKTRTVVEKIATILNDDHGVEHSKLFRDCASAVCHMKYAGYLQDGFTTPEMLGTLAYNMYKDTLKQLGESK